MYLIDGVCVISLSVANSSILLGGRDVDLIDGVCGGDVGEKEEEKGITRYHRTCVKLNVATTRGTYRPATTREIDVQ